MQRDEAYRSRVNPNEEVSLQEHANTGGDEGTGGGGVLSECGGQCGREGEEEGSEVDEGSQ